MTDGRINEQILAKLREHSQGDGQVTSFLIDLLYEEAEHSGQWWWKKNYRSKVQEYSEDWEGSSED